MRKRQTPRRQQSILLLLLAAMGLAGHLAGSPAATPPHPRTWTNPKDGSILIRIPAGPFTMGSGEFPSESPVHTLTLPEYYIGQEMITNAQFRRFVQAMHYLGAPHWERYALKWGEQAPAVKINWYDCQAYCKWAGVRLPTEAEWEKAARGPDKRVYPWGNQWDPTRCNNGVGKKVDRSLGPSALGIHPTGASPYGCLDMVGEAWQWCSTKFAPYPYMATDGREDPGGGSEEANWRVARGGCWFYPYPNDYRVCLRQDFDPTTHDVGLGFRVAK